MKLLLKHVIIMFVPASERIEFFLKTNETDNFMMLNIDRFYTSSLPSSSHFITIRFIFDVFAVQFMQSREDRREVSSGNTYHFVS